MRQRCGRRANAWPPTSTSPHFSRRAIRQPSARLWALAINAGSWSRALVGLSQAVVHLERHVSRGCVATILREPRRETGLNRRRDAAPKRRRPLARSASPGCRAYGPCRQGCSVMPEPGKDDQAVGHHREKLVVAAERSRLVVPVPVRLEGDLGHLAVLGPAGGDALGAAWAPPCSRTMSGCFSRALSSASQIRSWIVAVEPAGEGDPVRPGKHLGLGAAAGGEEVAAVDHRRGDRAVADLGPGAVSPGRPV